MNTFSAYDIFITLISCVTYVFDVGTDIGLILYFFISGYQVWGALTLGFVALATLTMQVFSFHWHITDRTMSWKILFLHLLFLAPLHRYIAALKLGLKSRRTGDQDDLDTAYKEVNDICILRLFETFLEAAPQLILQLYIIFLDTTQFGPLIGLSTFFSLLSVAWSLTSYSDALHLAYKKLYKRSFVSMLSQTLWQIGMVMSRVLAIVLFATVFQSLVLVPLGIHLLLMLIWITMIKPDFGATACERHMFTLVSAIIHTFCFLNLKDGQSRWRMLIYYLLMLIENSLMVLLWFIYKLDDSPTWLVPLAFSVVFGGFLLGVLFLMFYYGCCHASGPVPLPPPKPEFHKPPAVIDQSLKRDFESLKPPIPLFDVSSRSERINLWLSASLDLSKEGLCENPMEDTPGYTSLHTPGNHGDTADHSYSQMIRTPADGHRSGQELLHTSNYSPDPHMNRIEDRLDFSHMSQTRMNMSDRNKQVRLDSSHSRQDRCYGANDSRTSHVSHFDQEYNDGVNNSRSSRLEPDRSVREYSPVAQFNGDNNYRLDSNHSVPDHNLVEMFARCKLDPSYVSNSSINDSVFHISPVYTPERHDSVKGAIIEPISTDISGLSRKDTRSRQADNSCEDRTPVRTKDFSPSHISPLDPYKLWEESQNRIGKSPGNGQLFYQPDGIGLDGPDSTGMITILPDESRGISHLSLSYTDNNDHSSTSHRSRRKNQSLMDCSGSVFYSKDQIASRESVYLNQTPLNKSEEISFSNMSLPLPDTSGNQSRSRSSYSQSGQHHTSGSSTSGFHDSISDKSTPYRHQQINRSLSSYQDENSPSDQHSSYSSDRGLSISDRVLTSGSDTGEKSQRSFTSSGFQSEESNLSNNSPTYANQSYLKNQFHSAGIVENEIPSIRMTEADLTETVRRQSNADESIYSHQVTNQGICRVTNDQIAPTVLPSSPADSPSEAEPLMLPPLLSRRSSSAGSAGSGRFFKDPTLSDDSENGNANSSDESQYPRSTDSSLRRSQFNEKSSLSAMISDMSSSKCGDINSSDESLSIRSDRTMPSLNGTNREGLNKTRNIPYSYNKEHNSQPDQDESKSSAGPVYENIESYHQASLPSGVQGTQDLSSHSLGQNYTDPVGEREFSQQCNGFIGENEATQGARGSEHLLDDYSDSPHRLGRGVDLFSRERWRASLDKEMRDRLVSDLEKLAPRKLYQLQNKNIKNKLLPVELTEYTESPYKFRKPADRNVVKQKKPGTVLAETFDKQNEYENIKNFSTENDYNVSPNYLNQPADYENIFNSKELLCPVATPESLTDTCSLASATGTYSVDNFKASRNTSVHSPLENYTVRGELYLESFLDSINFRSEELSRTKSPINTSGINSAFRPVISRNKNTDSLTQKNNSNKTFSVLDTSSKENSSLSKTKDLSATSLERSYNASRSIDKSKRYSNVSQHSFVTENNNSTFPWSGAEDSSMSTSSHSFVNYLNLVGYPLDLSSVKVPADDTSKHSFSDSIPWEDSVNKSISFQNKSNASVPRSNIRQPLKALENTPVFSPIYGQDRRQSLEASARKRFMSTPKLSSGSEISLSRTSDNSGSLSESRYKHLNKSNDSALSSKSKNRSFSKGVVTFDSNGENTSTWSTQRSFGEKSSLSASTYI